MKASYFLFAIDNLAYHPAKRPSVRFLWQCFPWMCNEYEFYNPVVRSDDHLFLRAPQNKTSGQLVRRYLMASKVHHHSPFFWSLRGNYLHVIWECIWKSLVALTTVSVLYLPFWHRSSTFTPSSHPSICNTFYIHH